MITERADHTDTNTRSRRQNKAPLPAIILTMVGRGSNKKRGVGFLVTTTTSHVPTTILSSAPPAVYSVVNEKQLTI